MQGNHIRIPPDNFFTILVVEDNPNDFLLLEAAFAKNGIENPVQWMRDGLLAIKYLCGEGEYGNRHKFPLPNIIILDLKLPKLGGLELLDWIKSNPVISVLPVLVLSSSNLPDDVSKAYALGASSFFIKPSTFDDLVKLTFTIREYWAQYVEPILDTGTTRKRRSAPLVCFRTPSSPSARKPISRANHSAK
jgi:CheY-like chemotaxis protein